MGQAKKTRDGFPLKLSFVIPAYNEEACLAGCLASIIGRIGQAGADAEVIVVNNGSTDATRRIALSFPGVTVVDEPIKGLSRARQAGYSAAAGDLIANVDADNMLPEGWLEKVLGEFSETTGSLRFQARSPITTSPGPAGFARPCSIA